MTDRRPTLDCQACGNVVKILTPGEAQQVAANPYNFVVYCRDRSCQEMALAQSRKDGLA